MIDWHLWQRECRGRLLGQGEADGGPSRLLGQGEDGGGRDRHLEEDH